ncbi:MAG: type II toxin-antitoxin system RelE/ParE family toxin [Bacteroidetes bacterium]|nr:type II toxin-antitoxin system RelE/ParE family toxin [Bacteroidota bacterium]
MAKFYLTQKAVEDLSDIWDYTIQNWSERQAEVYYLLLIDTFKELSNRPNKGRSYDVISVNVLGFRTGQHIIFYREVSDTEIEVVRILHSKMDLKNHI